jgi:phospholipid/cholesterol/gamma-HCH transport system substrate-binding protein
VTLGARHTPPIVRALAIAALVGAAVVLAVVLLNPGAKSYTVTARFQDAGQLVPGGLVQVAGATVGEVGDIELTDDGQADITLKLPHDWGPLHVGTRAIVRAPGLSTAAGRYVDLMLGPATAPPIPDGGRIPATATQTAVDLDEALDLFDKRTRIGLQRVIRGSARQVHGKGPEQNEALRFLDPSLVATTRLFGQLNHNSALLGRFLTASGRLSHDLAQNRLDLAGLVHHGAIATNAIARDRGALGRAVAQLPDFQRRSIRTLADLRGALGDLRPLVRDSTPVTRRLTPLVKDVRALLEEVPPTVRSLTKATSGGVTLGEATNKLAPIALGPVQANGAEREGALPATRRALEGALPALAYGRPYAPELTGWFDDFGHSGQYDANGSFARTALMLSAFSARGGTLSLVPPADRGTELAGVAQIDQDNRCPGALERDPGDGSTPYRATPDYPCDPTQVPLGP